MDISAIVVVVVLTALSLVGIIGLEIYSRKTKPEDGPLDPVDDGVDGYGRTGSASNNGARQGHKQVRRSQVNELN